MVYPNITVDDLKKWCAIGGDDGSQHVPGKKIMLDEDEHAFGKLLSLLDLQITQDTPKNKIDKLKLMSKSEVKAYYQGRIDQLLEALANGIFSEATAIVMAVPTARFNSIFSTNPQDIPYAIQYMLRLNGFEINKECSLPEYVTKKESLIPIKNSDGTRTYGEFLDENKLKQSITSQKITGLPANVDYMLSLGQSENQKGKE